MTFKEGDIVMIKNNLRIGHRYYSESGFSDIFTSRMAENRGKIATIVKAMEGRYYLDIDRIHVYTDEMLDYVGRNKTKIETTIDDLINKANKIYYKQQLDNALKERLFEKDKEKFNDIYRKYKEFNECFNECNEKN